MMPLSRVILTARERHLLLHVLILQSDLSAQAFDQINVTLEVMDLSGSRSNEDLFDNSEAWESPKL